VAESGLTLMSNSISKAEPATMIDEAGQVRFCVAHCVLLVPSVHTPAWLEALAATAAAIGWDVVLVDLEQEIRIERPKETLAVVFDASSTYRLAIDRFAIISTGLISSPETVMEMFGVTSERSLVNASGILALGHTLAPGSTSRFKDADLLAGGSVFHAFEGVEITVPSLEPVVADNDRRREARDVLGFLDVDSLSAGASVEWPISLFVYHSGVDGNEIEGRIDVTGRARRLVLGPYICLPPGRWRAEVRFAVDQDTSRHHFRMEWGDMLNYTVVPFVPDRPGHYSLSATYDWKYPTFSELQLAISESSLGGIFLFEGVRIELEE
jgi:hypothetical protein